MSEPYARVPDVNQQVEFDITQGYRLKTCRRVVGERSHPPYVRDMAIIFSNGRWWLPAAPRTAAVGSGGLRMCPSSRRNRIDRAVAFR
jgi:hypothetical protein